MLESAQPELVQLLARLSLEKLLPTLLENDIDSVAELRLCTEEDYKEMAISIGMRRRLLDALSGGGGGAAGGGAGMTMAASPPQPASGAAPSAFSFIGAGSSGGGGGLVQSDEEALSAALRAAGNAASSAMAARPHVATGYSYEGTAAMGAAAVASVQMLSGPSDAEDDGKRGMRAAKRAASKSGLKAALKGNEFAGSGV